MKGSANLISILNGLLADELTAIHQYTVHTGMAYNWGYDRLARYLAKRIAAEREHADELIDRILFLEGVPIVTELNKITVGSDVPKQLASDLVSELTAVAHYNAAIASAVEVGDNATRKLLAHILEEEDRHARKIEERQYQIAQLGLSNFLATQI